MPPAPDLKPIIRTHLIKNVLDVVTLLRNVDNASVTTKDDLEELRDDITATRFWIDSAYSEVSNRLLRLEKDDLQT